MKCKYSITIWLFLAVLLLVACDNGERQRLQLAELERQNRADSLMLNDSLARDLAAPPAKGVYIYKMAGRC